MNTSTPDIWTRIAAPLPPDTIAWRQDGRPTQRQAKWFARFVAYVEAGTVRERLDSVVPGEWDLALDALPPLGGLDDADDRVSFKARLAVRDVIRECVGSGKDYKQAATDAFKRAAVRFGIGHELYQMEPLWVEVDGDGKFAKPLEDPAAAYARKYGRPAGSPEQAARAIGQQELPLPAAPKGPELADGATARELLAAMLADPDMTPKQRTYVQSKLEDADIGDEEIATLAAKVQETLAHAKQARISDSMARQQPGGNPQPRTEKRAPAASGASNDGASDPHCPICDGKMWDNRLGKRNPKAPDFKCKDRQCEGVIWPPKKAEAGRALAPAKRVPPEGDFEELPGALTDEDDDLPF